MIIVIRLMHVRSLKTNYYKQIDAYQNTQTKLDFTRFG